MDQYNKLLVTPKDKIKKNPAKVGKAVHDIISKPQEDITVGEIIDGMSDKFTEELRSTLEANVDKYEAPMYIVVLTKKEPWAMNVMRNWFIARQTKPSANVIRRDYPTYMQTVYAYDKRNSQLKIMWSLPIEQDARVVKDNPHLYDPTLVRWIKEFDAGQYN